MSVLDAVEAGKTTYEFVRGAARGQAKEPWVFSTRWTRTLSATEPLAVMGFFLPESDRR
jgi:hypothetical protein